MLRKIKLLLVLTIFLLTSPALGLAATYHMPVGDPENAEQGFMADKFREFLAVKTAGRIEIKNFFSTSLTDETEALRNVQRGAMPFAVAGIANLVPFDKRLGVITLPYMFENVSEAVAGTNGKAGQLLSDWALEKGFRILAWAYSDFRYISNSVRPIKNINDIKGISFRVPQNAIMIATFEAYGANPTPIAWEEVFVSLQQGLIEGQDSGYLIFKTMKFHEARQKYITEMYHSYQVQPLLVSEKFFQTLSKEDQDLMIAAGKYAQDATLEYQRLERAKAKVELTKMGIQIDMLEDEPVWKKIALEKVWPQMADFIGGEEIINEYLKAVGRDPRKANN